MKATDRLSAWKRQRELASDRRAGQFARSQVAKAQSAWVRRNWPIVGGEVAVFVAMLPFVQLLPGWSRGLVAGVWLATGCWLIVFQVVLASGTAPRMMGERGEQYTAAELRRLKRRGWRVINRVALKRSWDIDHVAIGGGGVLVIETKWSADPWTFNAQIDDRVGRATRRVADQAAMIQRMFPSDVAASAVVPLLVLWGGDNTDDMAVRVIDGVTVLRGRELRRWLGALEPDRLTNDQQTHAWQKLETTVHGRDSYDLKTDGPPQRTPGEWAQLFAQMLFAVWLGVLACSGVWTASKSFPVFFAAVAVFAAVGWTARRNARLAPAAVAWLVSVLSVGALVALVALASVL